MLLLHGLEFAQSLGLFLRLSVLLGRCRLGWVSILAISAYGADAVGLVGSRAAAVTATGSGIGRAIPATPSVAGIVPPTAVVSVGIPAPLGTAIRRTRSVRASVA